MCQELKDIDIKNFDTSSDNHGYKFCLHGTRFIVATSAPTRKLLTNPDIIGLSVKKALIPITSDILNYLNKKKTFSRVSILNILRGGLNFPVEEACFQNHININSVSFITSERIFLENKIARIESRYNKIVAIEDATLMLGDIIASGETISNALDLVIEAYVNSNKRLKRILIFTVGTANALNTIHEYDMKLKQRWSSFEGIVSVFYEGIFSTYCSSGITGLNLPQVDFLIADSFICPEYRKIVLSSRTALYEKCVIYDGGARRFEMKDHAESMISYWKRLSQQVDLDIMKFSQEKLGWLPNQSFDTWLLHNHYETLQFQLDLRQIFETESQFISGLNNYNGRDEFSERYEYVLELYQKLLF